MRVLLSPDGTPIPLDALPDPSTDGDVPPYTLLLPPEDFHKIDYVALGYTHYEVWCIGAVGGKGGTLQAGTGFDTASKYYGGAGGGGGLHHVAGLLADLPVATPVVIGQPGVDGLDNLGPEKWLIVSDFGDPVFPGIRTAVSDTGARPMVRNGVTYINADGSYAGSYRKINVVGDVIASNYHQSGWDASGNVPSSDFMVLPNAAFRATTDGGDGGYSAFGTVCKASGGKGGKRAPMFSVGLTVGVTDERWASYRRNPEDGWYLSQSYRADGHPGGNGGQGGKGGTLVAGGGGDGGSAVMEFQNFGVGGAGSYLGATGTNPEDGPWDGDVGEGGGGGYGGGHRPNRYSGGGVITDPAITELAQSGGQGSFNYGDTSKYGPREGRSADLGRTIIPGAGGGAKLGALQIYGGRSAGANPQGVVMLRIVRLV